MSYNFFVSSNINFGRGALADLPEIVKRYDMKSVMIVYDGGVKAAGIAVLRGGGASHIPKWYILAGICGIIILAFTVYCITKIGPVLTASITVTVQMIVATLTAHYGWFGITQEPINIIKIIGIILLVAGVVLVKISIKGD